jgi:hypothetical protein
VTPSPTAESIGDLPPTVSIPMPEAPGASESPFDVTETKAWPAAGDRSEGLSVQDFPADAPAPTRELSFGLEKPREGNLGRKIAAAVAVLAIVTGIGYASWSWDVRDGANLVGEVPPGPGLSRGTPAVALPLPPAEETDPLFEVRIRRPAPPVDEPELVETPPEARIPLAPDIVPTFPSN